MIAFANTFWIQDFPHTDTTVLSWYVQNFIVIRIVICKPISIQIGIYRMSLVGPTPGD